jgi:hypothetical protein
MSRVRIPIAKPATYSTFTEWRERAEAALQVEHGTKATRVRPGVWTKMYIRGLTPEDAARQAAADAFNKLPVSARVLGRWN